MYIFLNREVKIIDTCMYIFFLNSQILKKVLRPTINEVNVP